MSTQVSQPKAFMTAKELFEMPDDDYRYELVKGEPIKTKLSILILALIVLAVYFLPGQTFAQPTQLMALTSPTGL